MQTLWDPQQQRWVQVSINQSRGLRLRDIFVVIIGALIVVAVGLWLMGEVETAMFIADCEEQGGVAKEWTLTGARFCDLP